MEIEEFRKFKKRSVVIISAERCGGSWMCGIISEAYRQLSGGDPIFWDFEISRVIAITDKYNLPKAHCSVFYVDPEWVLNRDWNKIIILHRDLPSLKEALCRYYIAKLTPQEIFKKYPTFEKRIEDYYTIIYGKKIVDKRVLWVELNDLNNYPIAQFHEVLDFLEYPLETEEEKNGKIYVRQRPCFIPINPKKRDFDIQGTIINKGHGFDPCQIQMIEHGLGDKMVPIVDPDLFLQEGVTPEGYKKSTNQYLNFEYPNPYKITPEEWKYQECRTFRVKPRPMPDVLEYLQLIKCEV